MNVISRLKAIGCKVNSRESNSAVSKWWLTYPPNPSQDVKEARRKVLAALNIHDSILNPFGYQLLGGIHLEFQTVARDYFNGIFVAKPKKTKAGQLYRERYDDLALQDLGY